MLITKEKSEKLWDQSKENIEMNSYFSRPFKLFEDFHGQMGNVGLKLIHVTIN